MRPLALALLFFFVWWGGWAGCGGGGTGTLMLSWSFADGRGCDDSGAAVIAISMGGAPLGSFTCKDGLAPGAAPVDGVPNGSSDLELIADSPQGTQLYRGLLHLDALVASAAVTLYATGAR